MLCTIWSEIVVCLAVWLVTSFECDFVQSSFFWRKFEVATKLEIEIQEQAPEFVRFVILIWDVCMRFDLRHVYRWLTVWFLFTLRASVVYFCVTSSLSVVQQESMWLVSNHAAAVYYCSSLFKVKRCIVMEIEATRHRGHQKKTWWDCAK